MPDLGIQNIQFVLFKSSMEGLTAPGLYRKFAGTDADNTQTNRNPGPAAPFLALANGTVDDKFYNVQISPGRVDFLVAHPDRPSLGPWAWKLDEGVGILQKTQATFAGILPTFGKTNRLALNLTLLRNCSSSAEASATVIERAKVPQLETATDINIQFNRRTNLSIKNIAVNRLLRFFTSTTKEMLLSPEGLTAFTTERFLASLIIDINTVPSAAELDEKDAVKIFGELVSRAINIAKDATINALAVDDGNIN